MTNILTKPSDGLENPTRHEWIGWGYDSAFCKHCRVDAYDPRRERTEYCEDIEWALEEKTAKAARRHAATEEAITIARAALTAEQWKLLNLHQIAPYRDRDYIRP